ncbi:MAG: NnrU family protein [Pseudomonadota bacterium]
MVLIAIGLILWSAAHFWKRAAPDHRARFGEGGKGIVTLLLVGAIVLFVLGYRSATGAYYYGPAQPWTGINNLLVLLAFYLFAASGKGTRVTRLIRHPQLTAVIVWAAAHLMVNGDAHSFLLFGGLALWAVAEIVVINRSEGPRGPYHAPPIKSEVIAVVAAVVIYSIVAAIHLWLGVNPFV